MESKVVEEMLKMEAIVTITNEKRLDEVIVVGLGPRRWRRHLDTKGRLLLLDELARQTEKAHGSSE